MFETLIRIILQSCFKVGTNLVSWWSSPPGLSSLGSDGVITILYSPHRGFRIGIDGIFGSPPKVLVLLFFLYGSHESIWDTELFHFYL